jgi:DNA-binding CsgD family transcriptional regulator
MILGPARASSTAHALATARQQIIYLVREGKMTAADCARNYRIHESNISRLLAGAKAKD